MIWDRHRAPCYEDICVDVDEIRRKLGAVNDTIQRA